MSGTLHPGFGPTPGEHPPLRLPAPVQVFERRASRFRMLASGHAVGDYLAALASLAEGQRRACQDVPILLSADDLSPAVPLRVDAWHREGVWREALDVVLSEMEKAPLPSPAQVALSRLRASAPGELEAMAEALLDGGLDKIDLAAAPFVGAALQVYWTMLASKVPAGGVERSLHSCPICGSPPVAGTVGGNDKRRYLTCSLCAAEWHLTRVICSACGATEGISLFAIEGDPGAAKAEACARCRTYLKLFYLEKDPRADALADDVSTLSLDLLLSAEGYARGGVNLFLHGRVDS